MIRSEKLSSAVVPNSAGVVTAFSSFAASVEVAASAGAVDWVVGSVYAGSAEFAASLLAASAASDSFGSSVCVGVVSAWAMTIAASAS